MLRARARCARRAPGAALRAVLAIAGGSRLSGADRDRFRERGISGALRRIGTSPRLSRGNSREQEHQVIQQGTCRLAPVGNLVIGLLGQWVSRRRGDAMWRRPSIPRRPHARRDAEYSNRSRRRNLQQNRCLRDATCVTCTGVPEIRNRPTSATRVPLLMSPSNAVRAARSYTSLSSPAERRSSARASAQT